ncbi:peptidoglycan recognition protein family protein [Clostridium sulfidigenes]|uniref:peptidoglycan recognition protein family protein n=1 Tax=Clostridium sulfidigenes TaxID=318464 RepID=UPI0009FC4A64|nr:peptidoglycan recognition family protein [Clostridium sulfidigenes]HAR85444.1 N-acetylmuramoyl-L-alanine amidase [Clostridium sp.]
MKSIIRKISKYNFSSRSGQKIKYIVMHFTGNKTDTALNNANYFGGGNRNASAHYFVDSSNIVQVVEEINSSWHCGDGNGKYGITNQNSIGIEMCGTNDDISSSTESNTVELVKQLMNKYDIPSDRVVRHYDASRKVCPYPWSKNNWSMWNDFKKKLADNKPNKPISKELYRVRKSWKDADSQKGAYSDLANAKAECDKFKGYYVFNNKGEKLYPKEEEYDMKKIVTYLGDADLFAAVMVAQKLSCPLMRVNDFKASGLKAEQVIQIGGKANDTNRFSTMKNAANKYL